MLIHIQDNDNTNILFKNAKNERHHGDNHLQDKKTQKTGSVYGGRLNLNQDKIMMKKVMAHKKALKTVLDTYMNDKEIDDNIESRKQRISELQEECKEYNEELKSIADKKQQLREKYGITDDQNKEKSVDPELFAEYQTLVSEYDKRAGVLQKKLDDSNYLISAESNVISGIEKERLKTHAMVDAKEKASDILEEAGKEIIGMIIDDTKDQIDEDIKEKREKAEKEAKEKEEEELRLEELKAEKEEKKEKNNDSPLDNLINIQLLNEITKADLAKSKLQTEIKTMLNTQVVLDEDIKGIKVDKQL